eukprot:m.98478 g.98478  ORF g.98478 m.98478 type:complete len:273 (+) comp51406_c0_seq1:194-1012(+)
MNKEQTPNPQAQSMRGDISAIRGFQRFLSTSRSPTLRKHVRKLILCKEDLSDADVLQLAERLHLFESLVHLGLDGNNLTDAALEHLALRLPGCVHLHYLSLYGNQISDVGVSYLVYVLQRCPALKTVLVDANRITHSQREHLARAVAAHPALFDIRVFKGQNEFVELSRMGRELPVLGSLTKRALAGHEATTAPLPPLEQGINLLEQGSTNLLGTQETGPDESAQTVEVAPIDNHATHCSTRAASTEQELPHPPAPCLNLSISLEDLELFNS